MRIHRRLKEIYTDYRTSCLSKKYYGKKLERTKRLNLFCEILLAITASSAFASLKILSTTDVFGSSLRSWLFPGASAAAALLAVVKPLLAFDKEIERLTKLTASYAELHEQFRLLVSDIFINGSISESQEWHAQNLQTSIVKLSSLEDANPNRKKLQALQDEVREEIPSESLWYPEDEYRVPAEPCRQEGAEINIKDAEETGRLVGATEKDDYALRSAS